MVQPTKSWTTKAAKVHEGFRPQMFPSCTLVALVVNKFARCTTTVIW
jgi:hypothetical protein